MIVGYAIATAVSVLLAILYRLLIKKREFYLSLLFVCIAVVNLGYFLLSISKSVAFAIFANDLAYLGSVFLSTCMFFAIVKLCGFTVKKRTQIILISLASLMFLIVATSGFLPWYYKSVQLTASGGATVLVKEYGVLHPVYMVYLLGYFVAMIGAIVHSIVIKKHQAQKCAGILALAVIVNIGVWFLEKFVDNDFEFLSVSYLVSEMLFIMLYWLMQDFALLETAPVQTAEKPRVIVLDTLSQAEKIEKVLRLLPEGKSLTPRQMEILSGILDGKTRKEIASELMLSENTVKTHVATLYEALGVNKKEEIFSLFQME